MSPAAVSFRAIGPLPSTRPRFGRRNHARCCRAGLNMSVEGNGRCQHDIWAFGVVVYEMLTGRQLFGGATVSDTLASVLKEEPAWDLVPDTMRRLVRMCLVKDTRRRMRDI